MAKENVKALIAMQWECSPPQSQDLTLLISRALQWYCYSVVLHHIPTFPSPAGRMGLWLRSQHSSASKNNLGLYIPQACFTSCFLSPHGCQRECEKERVCVCVCVRYQHTAQEFHITSLPRTSACINLPPEHYRFHIKSTAHCTKAQ